MEIGIIGYKGHSLKLLNLFSKNKSLKKIIVYSRKISTTQQLKLENQNLKVFYSSTLSDLYNLKAIVISSSSNSHAYYIKKFIKKKLYIFCEKPAFVSRSDYTYLNNLDNSIKKKIYFNFNYKKSKLFLDLKKIILNKQHGRVVHSNIDIGHGIAFKKKYKNNWRFSKFDIFNNISGNLGIHYTNLLEAYFGQPIKSEINISSVSNKSKFDTATILTIYKKDITAKIFLSYATPFLKTISFYMTNALVIYSDSSISVYSPRETYNKNGSFKKPRRKKYISYKKEYTDSSLEDSVKYFFKTIKNNGSFLVKDYEESINSSKNILESKINRL